MVTTYHTCNSATKYQELNVSGKPISENKIKNPKTNNVKNAERSAKIFSMLLFQNFFVIFHVEKNSRSTSNFSNKTVSGFKRILPVKIYFLNVRFFHMIYINSVFNDCEIRV